MGGAEAGWVGEVGAATGSMLNAGTRFCAERGLIIIGTGSLSEWREVCGINSCDGGDGRAVRSEVCVAVIATVAAAEWSFLKCFLSPALSWLGLLLTSAVCACGELLPLRLVWPVGRVREGGEWDCIRRAVKDACRDRTGCDTSGM